MAWLALIRPIVTAHPNTGTGTDAARLASVGLVSPRLASCCSAAAGWTGAAVRTPKPDSLVVQHSQRPADKRARALVSLSRQFR